MSARGQWVFDSNSGGKKIPETVERDIEQRIHEVADDQFNGSYKRLDIRFRDQFCYLDAYIEPRISENWPQSNWLETREEYLERMRNTPVYLCRRCLLSEM